VERAPRDRRSFDIMSVKKEAKLPASEVNDVEVGRGEADLRKVIACNRGSQTRGKKQLFSHRFYDFRI